MELATFYEHHENLTTVFLHAKLTVFHFEINIKQLEEKKTPRKKRECQCKK